MINLVKRFIKNFFLYSSLVLFIININVNSLHALEKQNNKLIERIAKDYTKKFCNGIGFGLSTESAMNFAMKENNMIFEKKKGIEDLDMTIVADVIANSVVNNCGYRIGLEGDDGINQFQNNYIEMNK